MGAIQKTEQSAAIVPINDHAAMMATITRAAADPNVDIEKMERLWAMKERMDAKEAETAFNAALSRVQQRMGRIGTDKTNTQTRSDYATYGKLDSVLRPIYTAEGFSLSFGTQDAPEGMVGMVCFVSHSAGHTRTYQANVPSDGKGAKGGDVMTKTHAFGSGTSYGMRYLLKMIFNVAIGEEDDDGNAASGKPRITEEQAATLRDMLEATGSDTAKFLAWLKVSSIEAIPADAYSYAMSALKTKEKKA